MRWPNFLGMALYQASDASDNCLRRQLDLFSLKKVGFSLCDLLLEKWPNLNIECPMSSAVMNAADVVVYVCEHAQDNDSVHFMSIRAFNNLTASEQARCPATDGQIKYLALLTDMLSGQMLIDFNEYIRGRKPSDKNGENSLRFNKLLMKYQEKVHQYRLPLGEEIIAGRSCSIFYYLCKEKQSLLSVFCEDYYSKNFHDIDSGLIIKLLNDKPKNENKSALWFLSEQRNGRDFFAMLLQKNPAVVQSITVDMIAVASSDLPDQDGNMPPLFYLSGSSDGQEILKKLLMNDQFAEGVTAGMMVVKRTETVRFADNITPLYFLSGSTGGHEILKILVNYKQFVDGLTPEMLSATVKNVLFPYSNTSPIYWLSRSSQGREIFNMMLKNKLLINGITAGMLALKRPEEAGPDGNTSPLYWLSCTSDGREVFEKLLSSHRLVEEISAEMLLSIKRDSNDPSNNVSPMYYLSSTPDGQRILRRLFKNKRIVEVFSAKLCSLTQSDCVNENYRTESLSFLTSMPECRPILKMLEGMSSISKTKRVLPDDVGQSPKRMKISYTIEEQAHTLFESARGSQEDFSTCSSAGESITKH